MKYRMLLLCASLVAGPALAEPTANDYYRQGVSALETGNVDAARKAFQSALRINPNHGNARFQLLNLNDVAGNARVKVRQANLAKVKLAQVEFDGVTLKEALDDLGVMVEQGSKDEFIPNFVLEDPDGLISDNKISLRLRNMPANAVLQYILSQGKARAVWSEHAIAIRPLAAAGGEKQESPKAQVETPE